MPTRKTKVRNCDECKHWHAHEIKGGWIAKVQVECGHAEALAAKCMAELAAMTKERDNYKAMIEIEKNVPMPNGRCATREFPYSSMEIGDSFAVIVPPCADVGSFAARARGNAGVWGKKNGAKFSVLLVDEQKKVRVWRVA